MIQPTTLSGHGVRLEPLQREHVAALQDAVDDGDIGAINYVNVPGRDGIPHWVDQALLAADAGRVLEAIVKNIHSSLTAGGDVRISNLGVFDTAARAAREGRNPATGATIKIAASKAVRFRVSKPLKDAVNK